MTRVRNLRPDDVHALTDRYEDYEWWADRDVGAVREEVVVVEENGQLVAAVGPDRLHVLRERLRRPQKRKALLMGCTRAPLS